MPGWSASTVQALDEEEHETMEKEDDEENDDELWKLVLNDGDDVVLPVALDGLDDARRG